MMRKLDDSAASSWWHDVLGSLAILLVVTIEAVALMAAFGGHHL